MISSSAEAMASVSAVHIGGYFRLAHAPNYGHGGTTNEQKKCT